MMKTQKDASIWQLFGKTTFAHITQVARVMQL